MLLFVESKEHLPYYMNLIYDLLWHYKTQGRIEHPRSLDYLELMVKIWAKV